ncbi:MAG: hypothetical protein VYE64_05155 [Planctomycetota bacterium]|nr:hypothetical protein [Planctomycetota bacterium]
MSRNVHWVKFLVCSLTIVCLVSSVGCMGGLAQLLYVIKGHKIPAEYNDLEGKRVAVICISDASAYGPDTLTDTISKLVSMKLQNGVKGIKVIPAKTIEDWADRNTWDEADFNAIGEGVEADVVVGIQISNYSIKEGSTLYQGRCEMTATVFDIENEGQVSYSIGPDEFQFPEQPRPAIQTNDRKFEAVYLAKLAEYISRRFCAYDRMEMVAEDASFMH